MDTTIPELHYPDHQAPVWHSPYWAEVVAREQRVREEVAAEYRRDMKRIYDLAMEQKNLEMAFQCQQALAKHYELYKTSPLITRCKRLASSPAGEEIWQQLQELRKAWLANSTQEKQPVPENYYDQVRQAWRKRDAHVRQSLKDVMLEKTMRALDKHEREKQADESTQAETTDRSPASSTSDTGYHVSLSSSNKLNINSGMTNEAASAPRATSSPSSPPNEAPLPSSPPSETRAGTPTQLPHEAPTSDTGYQVSLSSLNKLNIDSGMTTVLNPSSPPKEAPLPSSPPSVARAGTPTQLPEGQLMQDSGNATNSDTSSTPRVNHLPLSAASQAMLAAVSIPNPETMTSTEVLKAMLNALAGNLEVKQENTPPDPEPPPQDSG